ncbi:hypothetical protein CBM2609_A170057 [Cupriavidus taiwanensis]|nr:hypothetical protein CBM2609_A170057 [Cupriavidus taiwanensis]
MTIAAVRMVVRGGMGGGRGGVPRDEAAQDGFKGRGGVRRQCKMRTRWAGAPLAALAAQYRPARCRHPAFRARAADLSFFWRILNVFKSDCSR